MKKNIMFLIIGVLIGAIITTIGFIIYNKTHKQNVQDMRNFDRGNFKQMMENGEMPEGMEPSEGFNGQIPEDGGKMFDKSNEENQEVTDGTSTKKQRNSKEKNQSETSEEENKIEENVSNEVSI